MQNNSLNSPIEEIKGVGPKIKSQLEKIGIHYVEDALLRWEPRIDQVEVEVQTDPAKPSFLLINVSYRVRAADSRFNLVYPFYLNRGSPE